MLPAVELLTEPVAELRTDVDVVSLRVFAAVEESVTPETSSALLFLTKKYFYTYLLDPQRRTNGAPEDYSWVVTSHTCGGFCQPAVGVDFCESIFLRNVLGETKPHRSSFKHFLVT